ncbi:MAG: hypothetical protein LBT09_08220 [Planctomycetaceae bacterium]|jgi:hypothetical protein|nr:hypothetical protein [Planctomycetaceae bacterium]
MSLIKFDFDFGKFKTIFHRRLVSDRFVCSRLIFKNDGLYFKVIKPNSVSHSDLDIALGWIHIPCQLDIERPFGVAYDAVANHLEKGFRDLEFEYDSSADTPTLGFRFTLKGERVSHQVDACSVSYNIDDVLPLKAESFMEGGQFYEAVNQVLFATDDDNGYVLSGVAMHGNSVVATDGIVLIKRYNDNQPIFDKPFVVPHPFCTLLQKTGKIKIGKSKSTTRYLVIDFEYLGIPIILYALSEGSRYPNYKRILVNDDVWYNPVCKIAAQDAEAIQKHISKLPTSRLDNRSDKKYVLLACYDGRLCIDSISQEENNTRLVCSASSICHPMLSEHGYAIFACIDRFKGLMLPTDINIECQLNNELDKDQLPEPDDFNECLLFKSNLYEGALMAFAVTLKEFPKDCVFTVKSNSIKTEATNHLTKTLPITTTIELDSKQQKTSKPTPLGALFSAEG